MNSNLLRFAFLFIICNSSFVISNAQWVTIPDSNFATYLQGRYPACMNGNQMDTTCAAIVNDSLVSAENLNMSDLTGIQYFDNLHDLYCQHNNLVNLPKLPAGLRSLICGWNNLTALPAIPGNVIYLMCNNNNLSTLPALPANLSILECSFNQLTNLPALPVTLQEFYCDNNQISSLPSLALFTQLYYLYCRHNQLTALPALPNFITTVLCDDNQITSISALPLYMESLGCSNNPLNTLPALPYYTFRGLGCAHTNLQTLPSLPATLTWLNCSYCQLTSLPDLPPSLSGCFINDNPNLHCIPALTTIDTLSFSNTGISCVANYGNVTHSNPFLNSLPVCDSTNVNGCAVYSGISSLSAAIHFSISPNPANNSVTISVDETMISSTATITDITGRKITAVQLRTSDTGLPTSNFSNGIYFITLENETGRTTKKLIIQK